MAKRKKKSTSEETTVAEAEVAPENSDTETEAAAETEESAVAESEEAAADEAPAAEVEAEEVEQAEVVEPSLEELEQARLEAAKNLEGWQRSAAELANFKRRQEEQLKLQRDRIKSELLEGVISALDDLDLAFQNVPEELNDQLVGWVEGFRLVQRKLNKILEDQNVMVINTEGEFDPNLHEAVSYEESEDHDEGEIIGELRKGYQIGNRVLRPALVRVAK